MEQSVKPTTAIPRDGVFKAGGEALRESGKPNPGLLPVVLGLLICIGASSVLLGWWIGSTRLVQIDSRWAPMQFNTALGFLLLGAGIAAAGLSYPRARYVFGWALLGLAGLSGIQYLTGWHLGVDTVFLEPWTTVRTSHPGRMAPETALGFALCAGSLLLLHRTRYENLGSIVPPIMGALALVMGTVPLTAYLAGIGEVLNWHSMTAMAAHTGLGFVVSGLVLILVQTSYRESGVSLWRAAVPPGCALSLTFVVLVLWARITQHELHALDAATEEAFDAIVSEFSFRDQARLRAYQRLSLRWAGRGVPSQSDWDVDAGRMVGDLAGLISLDFTDAQARIQQIAPAALMDEFAGKAANLGDLRAGLYDRAQRTRQPVRRVLMSAYGRGIGVRTVVPVQTTEAVSGFIGGFELVEPTFKSFLDDNQIARNFHISVSAPGLGAVYERSMMGTVVDARAISRSVQVGDVELTFRVAPTNAVVSEIASPWPIVVLITGLVVAFLIGVLVRMYLIALADRGVAVQRSRDLETEVAHRRQVETELREATVELKRSNAELEQFAYVASHDLQEPLRTIGSFSQLLEKRYASRLDGEALEFLDFLVEAATRMQTVIQDLLAYSRAGRTDIKFRECDLNEILEQAKLNLGVAIAESDARISSVTLPKVHGDPGMLAIVMQNLLGNAIKYRHPGQVPQIEVDAVRRGPMWRISVADNGIGIEPQYRERIFLLFKRLHTRSEYPGTGLGLSICQRIVERHSGRIGIESNDDAGSRFWIELPVAVPRGAGTATPGEPQPSVPEAVSA